MVDFKTKLSLGIRNTFIAAPFWAAGGALMGFVYGKFAYLPAEQIAKALAIFNVVELALIQIATSFSEEPLHQKTIHTVILMANTFITLFELGRRSLIGQKMMIFLVIIRAFNIYTILINPVPQYAEQEPAEYEANSA